ncbi:MAG: hypothetical protein R3307_06685 [Anaerolineales bacterium]|nr:hypothetical protein [Anaerolineales bacterium]
MAKKKNKKSNDEKEEEIIEQNEVEPVDETTSEPEADLSEAETSPSEGDVQAEAESLPDETDQDDDDPESMDDDFSPDDLLDDVRRSLIEENVEIEKQKKPKWWQKIGIGAKKDKTPDEPAAPVAETDEPEVTEFESTDEQTEEAGESIDELIEMLETEEEEASVDESEIDEIELPTEDEEPVVEVEKVGVDELKKRAFQGGKAEGEEESFSDVRAVALEDGEEVFVEVEVKTEDPAEDRLKAFENALRPYRRYIYFGIAFIGIVAIIATSAVLYDTLRPPPTPTEPPENLPYPVTLNIAESNITFNLGRGGLDDGRWNPRRPEWLVGTEICRWVAIPYNRQMEAVVRTLTRDDKLELVMSNNDRWSYDVFSITQMDIEEMQDISSKNSPCLLLVLADADTDTRWVVTAYP